MQDESTKGFGGGPEALGFLVAGVGLIVIPRAAVLARMRAPTLTDRIAAQQDLERRRARARALGVSV